MHRKINKMVKINMGCSKYTDEVSIASTDSRDELYDLMHDFLNIQCKLMNANKKLDEAKKNKQMSDFNMKMIILT